MRSALSSLLVRLIVEAFVEENAGEIQLLLQLEKGRMLHAQQAQADEYLTVQMRLHIGKLLLPDGGAPAEYPLLVVGFHSLKQSNRMMNLDSRGSPCLAAYSLKLRFSALLIERMRSKTLSLRS